MPQPTLARMAATYPGTFGPFDFDPRADQLVVIASDGRAYNRASPVEIAERIRFPSQLKPDAWYEAQLIHYGMQPSANLQLAMQRLHILVKNHHGGRPARVPRAIMRLEMQHRMRQRWIVSREVVRIGRAHVNNETQTRQQESVRNAPRFPVVSETALLARSIGVEPSAPGVPKMQDCRSLSVVTNRSDPSDEDQKTNIALENQEGSEVLEGVDADIKADPIERTIKRESSSLDEVTPTARASFSEREREVRVRDIPLWPGAQQAPPTARNVAEPSLPGETILGHLSGSYRIISRHPEFDASSRLTIAIQDDTLWARILSSNNYGETRSVIRLSPRPSQASSRRIEVEWRGWLDGVSLGHQQGYLCFWGNGRLGGQLQGTRGYSFIARRIEMSQDVGDEIMVESMREEWRSLGTEAMTFPDGR